MPRLWTSTIETHRREVREAILDATGALVNRHGMRTVTMSRIADSTGIGRATLYKYFPDAEAILLAWHERQIAAHLEHLERVRDSARGAGPRLNAVLEAYARILHESHGHDDAELAAFLHRDEHLASANRQLREMVRELISDAAAAGNVRDDVPPDELATYCLHALTAARQASSRAGVRRLVAVTFAGLRPAP